MEARDHLPRPVEFGDDIRAILETDVEDAVFVGVELGELAGGEEAGALGGQHHGLGIKVVETDILTDAPPRGILRIHDKTGAA